MTAYLDCLVLDIEGRSSEFGRGAREAVHLRGTTVSQLY